MAVTLLAIAKRDEGLPTPWIELGMIWLRTHVEGGICAVGACLLPYPKFATRDCAWRAQVGSVIYWQVGTPLYTVCSLVKSV